MSEGNIRRKLQENAGISKANVPLSDDINGSNSTMLDQKNNFEELKKLIGEQESRIQNLQSSAFQLANFYFVFQGVVFAAVSNSPTLTCSDSWFVFLPSLFAAILNLFALFSIGSKYIRAMNLHDKTWAEYNNCARILSSRNHHHHQNNNYQLQTLHYFTGEYSPGNSSTREIIDHGANNGGDEDDNGSQLRSTGKDGFSQGRRYLLLGACMVLFLAFTAVTLSGPWTVVCKHVRLRRRHQGGSGDCVELCNGLKCMSFCHRP